jgi:hypothetical protein
MSRTSLLLLPFFVSACYFSGSSGGSSGGNGNGNGGGYDYAPTVEWADASCYWDGAYHDYVWWFEADIADGNGLDDVRSVTADVYDGWTGEWLDVFELDYDGGNTWFSAWQGRSTYLDCEYYDYIVDFEAADGQGPGEPYTLDLF